MNSTTYDILVSYLRNEETTFVTSITKKMESYKWIVRDHPLPISDSKAQETEHIEFSYWLAIVTRELLESWSGLVSFHKLLKLLRKQRTPADSTFRILPLVLGNGDLSNRFHTVLPTLSSYRSLVTSSTSDMENTVDRVTKCIEEVLKKGYNYAVVYVIRWSIDIFCLRV